MDAIKQKLRTNITRREKIQLLTIAPKSWSRRKVAEKLNVSEYLVRKARAVCNEKGILAMPEPKEGRKLPKETIEAVKQFYEDDEFSYMFPGAKDRVSVQKNTYMQKRLLLCNLEELFIAFKEKHPNLKIGFSKFCSLRPKWCVLAGSPGTHCVCVCLYHQNVELLANAINQHDKEAIHIMMEKLVCNRQSRNCMLKRCDECPKTNEPLRQYLEDILEDFDDEEEIKFSQWISDGHMKLQTMLLPRQEFIGFLIDKIESLIPHSFITKSQNTYMRERKENLQYDEALVLMDFAENYNFVLQNEVQSYHWSHLSCSIHPVVVYSRSEGETTKESSLCFISNDLKHDVPFVYSVQEKTVEYIKSNFPNVTKIEYLTDGCSAQYKNYKSMVNLCYHKEDFGLEASWSFHATSHGKTVCDGIGGTVKRTVTKKNLQSARDSDQIINAEEMYSFCANQFSKISFFFLKENDIENKRKSLETRFECCETIKGTRSFHFFQPATGEVITAKRLSSDTDVCLKQNIFKNTLPTLEPNIHSFVACVYENNWWIGMIQCFNEVEGDYDVKFMHPHGPSETFFWPQKEDQCPVPAAHLLCIVNPPETTSLGRSYKIDSVSRKEIDKAWNIFSL